MSDDLIKNLSRKRSINALFKHASFEQVKIIQDNIESVVNEKKALYEQEKHEREQQESKAKEILQLIESEGLTLDMLNQQNATKPKKKRKPTKPNGPEINNLA